MEIRENYRIGRAKYVVSFYTGKTHADGSKFFDIRIFRSLKAKDAFITSLYTRKD